MASAAARVFALPELLENILLETPELYDLFRLRRINKTWRDAMDTSPKLRQRLYLDFAQPIERQQDGILHPNPNINPILVHLIEQDLIFKDSRFGSRPQIVDHFLVEPQLFAVYFHLPSAHTPRNMQNAYRKHLQIDSLGAQASWRTLKITRSQREVQIELTFECPNESTYTEVVSFAASEASLGGLVDAMDRFRKKMALVLFLR